MGRNRDGMAQRLGCYCMRVATPFSFGLHKILCAAVQSIQLLEIRGSLKCNTQCAPMHPEGLCLPSESQELSCLAVSSSQSHFQSPSTKTGKQLAAKFQPSGCCVHAMLRSSGLNGNLVMPCSAPCDYPQIPMKNNFPSFLGSGATPVTESVESELVFLKQYWG